MPLSLTTITLFSLVVWLILVIVATILSVIVVAGWRLSRQTEILSAQHRWRDTIEQIFAWFRRNKPPAHVSKWYTWEFPTRPGLAQRMPGSRFFTGLRVNQQRYLQYQQHPRDLDPYHFDTYVTVLTPEIESLVQQLLQLGQTQSYSAYEQLCNTLAFVQQNIRYADDLSPQTGQIIEYPKYPLETLMDKRGDCEDQSILTASLLTMMGYKVALLILPTHVALGIAGFDDKPGNRVVHLATGSRYLYTETTAPNWLPGEVPDEFRPYLASGQFEVLPLVGRGTPAESSIAGQ